MLVGCFIYIARVLQAPSSGYISPVKVPTHAVKTKQQPGGTLSDSYISFNYPAGYIHQDGPHQGPGNLDYYVLPKRSAELGGAAQIGVTVKKLEGSYANDSAYTFRQKHPESYTAGSESHEGVTLYTFMSNSPEDGYEKTVFWPHGNLLAIITLKASFSDPSFTNDFQQVINSWRWKQ